MSNHTQTGRKERAETHGLGHVVWRDLRQARPGAFLGELRELYNFYLDEESRTRLAGMGRMRRAVALLGWVASSLLLKLSPARRIMLLVAVVLTVLGHTAFRVGVWGVDANFAPWGFLLLVLVLMLELKDKLLVRDEIEVARQVQLMLLPRETPTIPGWSAWSYSRPANDVGGDLVDYIELDGFRHGVVLGDVAGKGLGAALLSSKLQATLRALAPEAASLDDLAARVNTILLRDGLDNRYATLFYIEVEHDSGEARYLNAGHNPAFVMREDRIEMLGGLLLSAGDAPGNGPRGVQPEPAEWRPDVDLLRRADRGRDRGRRAVRDGAAREADLPAAQRASTHHREADPPGGRSVPRHRTPDRRPLDRRARKEIAAAPT